MARNKKTEARLRRKKRIHKKVQGTPERPRLNIFRSTRHIYAQIIDDTEARTLVAASTLSPELAGNYGGGVEAAKKVGDLIAKKALEKGIESVVFDRGGFQYHGRVKAMAEAAREGGLKF